MQVAVKVFCAVVCLVANTETISGKRCPKVKEIDWEMEVLLPHRECDKFYQCTHGEPVEISCPKGLFYSIIEQVCEWKDRVDCGGRIIPQDKRPKTTPGSGDIESDSAENPEFPSLSIIAFRTNGCPIDPRVHWLLPHESVCKWFYYCEGGVRELRRCPFGLYFNKKRQVCDWPWDVNCEKTKVQ